MFVLHIVIESHYYITKLFTGTNNHYIIAHAIVKSDYHYDSPLNQTAILQLFDGVFLLMTQQS